MNRFETYFGDTGLADINEDLYPFGARYRFLDRTWSIVIWARNFKEASAWAKYHNMIIDGQIIESIE